MGPGARRLPLVLAGLCALFACPAKDVTPGSEELGTYRFYAEPVVLDCSLDEFTSGTIAGVTAIGLDGGAPDGGTLFVLADTDVATADAGFLFDATFSWTQATGGAWVTLSDPARQEANEGPFGLYRLLDLNPQQNQPRPGAWDGQEFRSTDEVPRVFPSKCSGCGTSLEEVLDVVLYSRSQSAALGNQCPPQGSDAGLPTGPEVTTPQSTAYGYDAVRGCGTIRATVLATDGGACDPACSSCRVTYRVTGERR